MSPKSRPTDRVGYVYPDSIPHRILQRLPSSAPQLSEELGISINATHSYLERLVTRKLVTRRGSTRGLRGYAVLWAPTKEGQRILEHGPDVRFADADE